MYFFVRKYDEVNIDTPTVYPHAILHQDNWDDFGYKTTFYVKVFKTKNEEVDLGVVKILHIQQEMGFTPIVVNEFESLTNEFCSLGGDLDYYIKLFNLGEDIYTDYLQSINDVTINKTIKLRFESTEGYKVSLLRFNNIEAVMKDAETLFKVKNKSFIQREKNGINFTFTTKLGSKSKFLDADFNFRKKGLLPNRINVVIGYNGSGKTRLLSNLAVVASGFGYENKSKLLEKDYGFFSEGNPNFKPVIVVSYSAFDTFPIPGNNKKEREKLDEKGNIFGYVYCGLRKTEVDSFRLSRHNNDDYLMKSMEEINDEFSTSLKRIYSQDKSKIFSDILKPLISEPSFRSVSIENIYRNIEIKEFELANFYTSLSSGHKIIIKILADITAQMSLSQPSLLLIDEPEVHLHPSLQAAFLKSIRICLELFDGYAILTTHSPVILQEMPSQYVRILKRLENSSIFEKLEIETFGENINVITEAVFNLDDSMTNWSQTLKSMSTKYSPGQIESFFGKSLGFAPRSYLASISEDEEDE
ncbi:AAA family ATPase [Rahnella aceris]